VFTIYTSCQFADCVKPECVEFYVCTNTIQENNIEKVKIGQKANLPKEELAQLTITVIDQLIADCR